MQARVVASSGKATTTKVLRAIGQKAMLTRNTLRRLRRAHPGGHLLLRNAPSKHPDGSGHGTGASFRHIRPGSGAKHTHNDRHCSYAHVQTCVRMPYCHISILYNQLIYNAVASACVREACMRVRPIVHLLELAARPAAALMDQSEAGLTL